MNETEFLVRDTRMPGHFWADNEVMDIYGPLLGAHGMAVYMALCRQAINGTGECKISTAAIARKLDISKGGAFNALTLIMQLGLARQLTAGTPRTPAVYVLADVKSLTNPEMAQMRLASVHTVNAQSSSIVHGVNSRDHQVNANGHGVNAAFTIRTPNKEVKTLSRLKTNKTAEPCSKCNGKGFYELKGHPGRQAYCGCSVGKEMRVQEKSAQGWGTTQ